MRVEVERGQVIVSQVLHVIDHPDVHVFEVDLVTKYPAECYESTSERDIHVSIPVGISSCTIDASTSDTTVLRFFGDGVRGHDWSVITDSSRYLVRVALYKLPITDEGMSDGEVQELDVAA